MIFTVWAVFLILAIIVIVGYFGNRINIVGMGRISSWPLSEAATWSIIGILFLYMLPYFFSNVLYWEKIPMKGAPDGVTVSDWWWNKTMPWRSIVGFVLIMGMILFGSMSKKDPSKPFHHKLAKIGIWVVIPLFVWHLFGGQASSSMDKDGVKSGLVSVTTSVKGVVKGAIKGNASVYYRGQNRYKSEAIRFWYGNIPSLDAWDMIDTIKLESEFIHFNRNGSVLRGNENPNDIGLHQINTVESVDEIREAGCNVEDIDCQFEVALLIYRKYGLKRWVKYEQVKSLPVSLKTIDVPVGSWSEIYNVEFNSNCHWTLDRNMTVKDKKGDEYEVGPEKFPNINSPTQQFLISDYPHGKVEIRCRH